MTATPVTSGFLYQQTKRQGSVTILKVVISRRYMLHPGASLGTPLPILKANGQVPLPQSVTGEQRLRLIQVGLSHSPGQHLSQRPTTSEWRERVNRSWLWDQLQDEGLQSTLLISHCQVFPGKRAKNPAGPGARFDELTTWSHAGLKSECN